MEPSWVQLGPLLAPKTFKNLRKTNVFEGFQGTGGSQVGPKMAPSWAKMGLGSECKLILGHVRRKIEAKMKRRRLESENDENTHRKNSVFGSDLGPKGKNTSCKILRHIAGTGGPRIVFNYLGKRSRRPAPVLKARGGGL